MKRQAVLLCCPDCETKLVIEEILVSGGSAGGEMMLHLNCVKCDTKLGYVSDFAKMILVDIDADAEDKVALPSPRLMLHQEQQWERQFGSAGRKEETNR